MIAGLPGVDNGLTPINTKFLGQNRRGLSTSPVLEMLLLDDLILFWR